MGTQAIVVLATASLLIGFSAQWLGELHWRLQWLCTGAAAFAGGFLASQYFDAVLVSGPAVDGLHLIPALVGALVVGGLVDLLIRSTLGEPV